jgi:DNA (cytosine-5)-methyltransferase 1
MISERYERNEGELLRIVSLDGEEYRSVLRDRSDLDSSEPLWKHWWYSYLRGSRPVGLGTLRGVIRIVDLFCGCGGLSLGAAEAVTSLNLIPLFKAAVDVDRDALTVYERNLGSERLLCTDVGMLVAYEIASKRDSAAFAREPRLLHPSLMAIEDSVDVVLAGPPCEGHSNLNNRTRRVDPRNRLVLDAVAVAVALRAKLLIVENVAEALADRSEIFDVACRILGNSGYRVELRILSAEDFAVAQRRRRLFMVASTSPTWSFREVDRLKKSPPPDLRWAIGDLEDASEGFLDRPARQSLVNQRRIDYLFERDEYELPSAERPKCHRNSHTYPSVYGRLRWEEPAGTITTGFMTMGRGRFVHPSRRRTLTPHEAARLQGFPDTFVFTTRRNSPPTRSQLAKWIGDAVPPPLAYAVVLSALAPVVHQERASDAGSQTSSRIES